MRMLWDPTNFKIILQDWVVLGVIRIAAYNSYGPVYLGTRCGSVPKMPLKTYLYTGTVLTCLRIISKQSTKLEKSFGHVRCRVFLNVVKM